MKSPTVCLVLESELPEELAGRINQITDAGCRIVPLYPQDWCGAFDSALGELRPDVVHFILEGSHEAPTLIERAFQLGYPVLASIGPEWLSGFQEAARFELSQALRVCRQVPFDADAKEIQAAYSALAGEIDPPETDRVMSVVIATFNRPQLLRRCLRGFVSQALPRSNFEVVVVDDASSCDIGPLIQEFKDLLPLVYVRNVENLGPSGSRNAGILKSRGDYIAFFDDDDVPGERYLAEHLAGHLEHSDEFTAVLGFIGLPPETTPSPLMYHITQVGCQYLSYPGLQPDVALPWHYFWSGAISCKRALFSHGEFFDESLRMLEDIELAYRLRKFDLRVVYRPRAVSYLSNAVESAEFAKRWTRQGGGIAALLEKHDDSELRRFFNLESALDRWDDLEPLIPMLVDRIAELERMGLHDLRSKLVRLEDGSAITAEQILHQAYSTYFEALRTQGILEGMKSG